MNSIYNLHNLEPKFKSYLSSENISPHSSRNYLSDIRHFLGWLADKDLNVNSVRTYKKEHIKNNLPIKTINRRLSALRKFFEFCMRLDLIKFNPSREVKNVKLIKETPIKITSDKAPIEKLLQTKAVNSEEHNYFFLAKNLKFYLLLMLFSVAGIMLSLFFPLNNAQNVIQSSPLTLNKSEGKRLLAFSGQLKDKLGNPINTKTDVVFNLHDSDTGANIIYSASCIGQNYAITPDVQGNFRIILGTDCGSKPIPSSLFIENPNIYLGIRIQSDSEMLPREKIPNVGYALNSDKLQGFNIGNESSSIPYINHDGNLLIAVPTARIESLFQSAEFTISSANSMILQSANAGDVILQSTESGNIKFRTDGGNSDEYTRFVITQEGNIGIGTLNPTKKLEVLGDLYLNGGQLRLGNFSSEPVPTGIGSLYFNSTTGKPYYYNGFDWVDLTTGEQGGQKLGGLESDTFVYSGNLENLNEFQTLVTKSLNALDSQIEKLIVSQKITSPVIESERVITNEIKPQNQNLTLNLENNPRPVQTGQQSTINNSSSDKGPLAKLIIKGLEGKTVASVDSAGNASFSGSLTAQSVNANRANFDQSTINNLTINNDATISGTLAANEASLSGKLVAREIEAENINEIQKQLADIKNQPLPSPQYYQPINNPPASEGGQQLTINNLTVGASSNLYNLSVTGSSTIGNLLIENNSLLSLAWDLKLSALSTIRLFDDSVIIAKDGSITTKGTVVAEGGIKTNKIESIDQNGNVAINKLTTNQLTINDKYLEATSPSAIIAAQKNFDTNGIFSPAIETKTASAGNGLIDQNTSEVIVYNSNIKESSLIYITPTSQVPTTGLTVIKKETCSSSINHELPTTNLCKPYFKVALDKLAASTVNFNWLIIN